MRVSYDKWLQVLRVVIKIINKMPINYVLFGAAAYASWVEPIMTKDIDILLIPFPPEEKQREIISRICNELRCVSRVISMDALKGNRLIMQVDYEDEIIGIEMWAKILRRDASILFSRAVKRQLNDIEVRVLSLEDFLATKICDLTPEPRDIEIIEKTLRKFKDTIDIDKIAEAIIDLHHEATAIFNILEWYKGKLPLYAKTLIKKLLKGVTIPVRNYVIQTLEQRGDPINRQEQI